MFLHKYVNSLYLDIIFSNYDESYIELLDETNFVKIYQLFKNYQFYYIDDIILKYLEIFEMHYDDVEQGILLLKEKLGEDFVRIIGNDMTYLDEIYSYEGD